jgi:hypothetical protein
MPVPQDYYMLDLIKRLSGGSAPAEPTQGAAPVEPTQDASADVPWYKYFLGPPSKDSSTQPEGTRGVMESLGRALGFPYRDDAGSNAVPVSPQGRKPLPSMVAERIGERDIQPPVPTSEPGALRFSVGGKWYERAPGTSGGTFETTPRQTDKGMAFDRGAPASAGDMSAVRQQVRSQGAFGSTTPLGPDRGPGGFSPSPRVEDVAVMPESVLEEQDKQRIARELSRANADMSPVSDEELPPELSHLKGLGLSRGEMRSILAGMLTANRGSDKANALPILNAIDAQWRAEVKKVREDQSLTPEQKAENEAILTQNMLDARKAHGFEAPQGML